MVWCAAPVRYAVPNALNSEWGYFRQAGRLTPPKTTANSHRRIGGQQVILFTAALLFTVKDQRTIYSHPHSQFQRPKSYSSRTKLKSCNTRGGYVPQGNTYYGTASSQYSDIPTYNEQQTTDNIGRGGSSRRFKSAVFAFSAHTQGLKKG